jgi:hypothetical protein
LKKNILHSAKIYQMNSPYVSEFGLDVSGPLFIILGPVGGSTQVSSSSPVFPSVVPCPK